jgi:hypothetical protein
VTSFHDAVIPLPWLQGSYRLRGMLGCALRRIWAVLLVLALFGAGMGQTVSAFAMTGPDMTMAADSGSSTDGESSPCKGTVSGCMTDLGCIFLIGLPAPHQPIATRRAWASVSYWATADRATGLALAPDLGPPIHIA